ncbi:MAG: hypothetical protein IGR76_10400 [Synechococcales cyanobacterium T60_A2020_003]|nr:hypothetical protein [Synechococcales cyanobacterium T60_A2020_003]
MHCFIPCPSGDGQGAARRGQERQTSSINYRQPQLAGNQFRAVLAAVTLTYRDQSYERQMPAFNRTQSLPTPAFTLAVAS